VSGSLRQDRGFPFWLFVIMAVVGGILFFYWGQSNTAATLYELGFDRYRAIEQLAGVPEWLFTAEEAALYDSAQAEAAAWADENPPVKGEYTTDTAGDWFGEAAHLTLEYEYYDRGTGKTVILLHGFEEADAPILWAPWWWEQGYGVLIPTLRGYQEPGETNMTPTTYGVYEEFDIYDLIRALGLTEETVLIHAKGNAAAGALLLAANESLAAAGVDGIIAESVYSDLATLERTLVKKLFKLGDYFVGRLLRSRISNRLGFRADSVDIAAAAAANGGVPVLFIASEQEVFPGAAETATVYDACAARKEMLILTGSYRALGLTSGEEYRAAILDFFGD